MRKAKQSPSQIFFEKKDEAFIHKENLKTQISSRMGEFISPEAIQLLPKFALANLSKPYFALANLNRKQTRNQHQNN